MSTITVNKNSIMVNEEDIKHENIYLFLIDDPTVKVTTILVEGRSIFEFESDFNSKELVAICIKNEVSKKDNLNANIELENGILSFNEYYVNRDIRKVSVIDGKIVHNGTYYKLFDRIKLMK